MIVQLLSNPQSDIQDLTVGQFYLVIGIEADDFRIINDEGRPYLYPADWFKLVDSDEPAEWMSEYGDDGERYAYPPELNAPGFFEDFFQNKPEAVRVFWQVINSKLTVQTAI